MVDALHSMGIGGIGLSGADVSSGQERRDRRRDAAQKGYGQAVSLQLSEEAAAALRGRQSATPAFAQTLAQGRRWNRQWPEAGAAPPGGVAGAVLDVPAEPVAARQALESGARDVASASAPPREAVSIKDRRRASSAYAAMAQRGATPSGLAPGGTGIALSV